MAVTVHRPEEIFLKAVRVAVLGDHFSVVLQSFKNPGRVSRGRYDRPDDKRKAQKRREGSLFVISQGFHQLRLTTYPVRNSCKDLSYTLSRLGG